MTGPSLPSGPGLTVRRVRCRTSQASRRRLLDALDYLDTDLRLPRSAILAVRHLDAAITGSPPRIHGVDLADVARRAHRPKNSVPPPDCAAVLFTDEAELLVCLAAEVAAGGLLGWWWNVLLGPRGAGTDGMPAGVQSTVTAAFATFARALPAAAAAASDQVIAAARHLGEDDLRGVLAAMAGAHDARRLAAAAIDYLQQGGDGGTGTRGSPVAPRQQSNGGEPGPPTVAGSSRAGVAHSARAHVVLVACAALLHRDPARARRFRTADDVARLLAGTVPPAGALMPIDDEPRRREERASSVALQVSPRPSPGDEALLAGQRVESPRSADAPNLHREQMEGAPEHVLAEHIVRTALGGAFYVLALLDLLDLPASASGEGEPGPLLNRWGVLALVLQAWGADPDDELLPLLDQLAGPQITVDHQWAYRRPAVVQRWFADAPDGPALADVPAGVEPFSTGAPRWAGHLANLLTDLLARVGLTTTMIAVPARIELTGLRLGVHLPMDRIDLGVRRAGLDRDPGWSPALGRVVELIFE